MDDLKVGAGINPDTLTLEPSGDWRDVESMRLWLCASQHTGAWLKDDVGWIRCAVCNLFWQAHDGPEA